MDAERWRRLEQLFDGMMDLDPAARSAWLDLQCAGDLGLRAEVEKLVAASGKAASAMAAAVGESARSAYGRGQAGARIGPYEVLAEIGRGGMGVVYLARRNDDVFHKEVAIKVVKRGMDTDQVLTRFRHERRILARLEHPYISRILDGGSTDDGLPYLVMEHIRGLRITDYCEQLKLDLPARLELFRLVCAAVEYAHHNLVVHRDLKPSNILVDVSGAPKLLDFGIAKLLDDTDGEGISTLTREGGQLLTPRYASPEQIKGEPITTASDIYSLGAILYELLTGTAAHRITSNTPAAVLHAVCEEETIAPSVAARGSSASPFAPGHLAGDLDNILLAAMRKEPQERYGSVLQFSDDVRRYLENRPVLARPQTARYRAAKFLRRNRAGVLLVSLLVLSLIAGLAFSTYQARRAERRFQQVRQLANSMIFGVDDRIRNLAGATEAREWELRTALQYLDNLSREAGNDRSLLLDLATAYQKIGDVQGYAFVPNLGHYDQALISHRKALAIAERLAASDPDRKIQMLIARAHGRIGTLLTVHSVNDALREYAQGVAAAERLEDALPGDPEASALLVDIDVTIGQVLASSGRIADANDRFSRALRVAERWNSSHPDDRARAGLALCHRWMARALRLTGDFDAALVHALESERIRKALVDLQPANVAFRRDLMNSYEELGYIQFDDLGLSFGDRSQAVAYHQRAMAIAEQLARADVNSRLGAADLIQPYSDLCRILADSDVQLALENCRKAMDAAGKIAASSPPAVANASLLLADVLRRLGRRGEAFDRLHLALGTFQALFDQEPSRSYIAQALLRTHNQSGAFLLEIGDRQGALEHHRIAVSLASDLFRAQPANPIAHIDLANSYEAFAHAFEKQDWAQARELYGKSLDIWNAWPRQFKSGIDQQRRRRVLLAVARCDAALARR